MDTQIIQQEEISHLSKKTIEINDSNIFQISLCSTLAIFSCILSILLIPSILGKILGVVITVILYIISLFMIEKKLEIIKDSVNKKVIVLIMNYLGRAKTTLIFDQENVHFIREITIAYTLIKENKKTSNIYYYTFYIINDFKNLVDIDLNESNIRRNLLNIFILLKK